MELSQALRTQQTISPALQKSLQLLQMNALEFAQEINEALDQNPLLEREDEDGAYEPGVGSSAEAASDEAALMPTDSPSIGPEEFTQAPDDATREADAADGGDSGFDEADYGASSFEGSGSGKQRDGVEATAIDFAPMHRSLREHLLEQLGCLALDPLEAALGRIVVDSLDASGYLRESTAELVAIAQDLARGLDEPLPIDVARMEGAVRRIQGLDPVGIAATSISQCLALQLQALPAGTAGLDLAHDIVSRHLDLLGQGDFRALGAATGASTDALASATRLIRSLDPKPGLAFGVDRIDYAVPEVIVYKKGRRWEARLHPHASPKIRINAGYASIVARSTQSKAMTDQLTQAKWLMRSIEQRASTIELTAKAIVARQQQFFEHGDIGLRPMRLADIAADIGIHESTVSRVVNSKYLQAPGGLISLKKFFTSHVSTAAGNACSATAVKAMIRQLLKDEPPTAPISDHMLARLLDQRGIRIARRTVTKYRCAIGIEAVEMRRHAPAAGDLRRDPSGRGDGRSMSAQ